MSNLTSFFFDLDDTLIDYEAAFEQASLFAFTALHPEYDMNRFFRFFKQHCDNYWSSYENGSISRGEYQALRYIKTMESLEHVPAEGEAAAFQKLLIERVPSCCSPFSWTEQVLSYLHDQRIPWGIITNGYSSVQRAKMRCLSITPNEEMVFISEENGLEKPDPEYFRFVQHQTGWKTPVYIGNSLHQDVLPAKKAGWRTIWLSWKEGGTPIITPDLLAGFLTS